MATTPRFALPYLTLNDPPDLAGESQALATAVEGALARGIPVANAAARLALGAVPEVTLVRQRDDGSVWVYTDLGTWAQINGASTGGGGGGGTGGPVVAAYSATSAQTLANAANISIAFGNGSDSTSVTRSTMGVGHKFTCAPGTYLISACVRFAAGTAGSRFAALRKADDSAEYVSAQNDGGPNAATRSFSTTLLLASSTDLYIVGSQSSGSSLATEPTGSITPANRVSATFTRIG